MDGVTFCGRTLPYRYEPRVFGDDERNSRTRTVLLMHIGGLNAI